MFAQKQLTIPQALALFFSLPLDEVDWRNLERSGARRVMLDFYISATDTTLKELQRRGYGVILRLNDQDASTRDLRELWSELQRKKGICPNIDTVIIGNEPDVGLDFKYNSTGWYGEERAWPHAQRVQKLIDMLAGPGWKLVTPGWECHVKSEDDPPHPGVVSWRDYCAEAYQDYRVAGHGAHLYAYAFKSIVDEIRVKWQLRELKERFHRGPIYLDEVGFASGDSEARMRQFVAFLGLLAGSPGMMDRVALIVPFVSNGTGQHYEPQWVLRSPASYDLLGAFLRDPKQPLAA